MPDQQQIGSQLNFILEADCYVLVCNCMLGQEGKREWKVGSALPT